MTSAVHTRRARPRRARSCGAARSGCRRRPTIARRRSWSRSRARSARRAPRPAPAVRGRARSCRKSTRKPTRQSLRRDQQRAADREQPDRAVAVAAPGRRLWRPARRTGPFARRPARRRRPRRGTRSASARSPSSRARPRDDRRERRARPRRPLIGIAVCRMPSAKPALRGPEPVQHGAPARRVARSRRSPPPARPAANEHPEAPRRDTRPTSATPHTPRPVTSTSRSPSRSVASPTDRLTTEPTSGAGSSDADLAEREADTRRAAPGPDGDAEPDRRRSEACENVPAARTAQR